MYGGGGAAAAAAQKKKRELEIEEEEMTGYSSHDMQGWEFKIVRSATGTFKDYKVVKKVCEEESESGWELVEKFDNSRLRFKRKTDHRAQDAHRQLDPYRTSVGLSEGKLAMVVVISILTILGTVLAIALAVK